jgi:tRNA uridine 5-carboxymethylaminomethyl modification enzyme
VSYADLPGANQGLAGEIADQVEFAAKYAGYVQRQETEVHRFREMESKAIPEWIDYSTIAGLKTESRHKLGKIMPRTIGQASRISGVSPADISLLLVWIKRGRSSETEETKPDGPMS